MEEKPQRLTYYVLEDAQSLPEGVRLRVTVRPHVWRPPTDVYETEEEVIVRVEIAGVRDSDFTIVLDGHYLSIRGVRLDVPERRAYHQMEIPFGEFSTEVELPCPINTNQVEALYSNGFLRISLAKARPQKIPVD